MQITIDISDALATLLEQKWGNLEQKLLELWVVEAYRDRCLSAGKAKELLGLSTYELDNFLKEREVYLHYGQADLEQDLRTLGQLRAEEELKV